MTDKYRVITGTHVDVCPDMPIPCPNKECNEVLLRKLMEEHRGKCFKEILQCPYGSFIRCQEKVKRENLAQHEHDNVTQHLKMAIEKIKELSQENTKLFTLMSPSTRILKLEKFTEHKEKSNVWYSQGIYTSPGGYKMCLSVYANGNGGATGSHVSCFVHLMRGEYDHLLEWPFKGEVMVELLNQLEDKRHEREIFQFNDLTPIEYRCRVLSNDIGRGGGVQKFIPHPQLNFNPSLNCQYLKDDTVYFRMSMKVSSLTKPWLIN
jgi:TNF receptor-associated factor 4